MERPTAPKQTADRGGMLVLDKPAGMSSHDVVAVVRRTLRNLKIGHTGTLDPFATGVLPLVVGQATRLAQFYSGADKEYDARIRLGRATDSYDVTGSVTFEAPAGSIRPSAEAVAATLRGLVGPLMQVPPAYSAKMTEGVRAYERARRGIAVELQASAVTLHQAEVVGMEGDLVDIRLTCSAGFYVRSLAHDMGVSLGTGASVESLRRTRSGAFGLDSAVTLDAVPDQRETLLTRMIPLDTLLQEFPAVVVTEAGVQYVRHGRNIGPSELRDAASGRPWPDRVRLVGPDGALLAIAEPAPGPVLHPAVVVM
ncbi:MAG: tRNA pseudouridine(55) synthase TruB [Acidobacteria bacterium]|nr:tRNA pseudouridine(55) synthase TruB [Acidobacteriota bacterium]